jgi:uncharacterized protein
MKIVWDDNKRKANIIKHGYDFADFDHEMLDKAYIEEAHSNRFKAIFLLKDNTVIVIFGFLGREAISIISMRPARKDERKLLV